MSAPRVVATPLYVSDLTAPVVLGISPRAFRRLVKEHGLPVARVARRTLVRVDVLTGLLDGLAGAPRPAPGPWDEEAAIREAAK